MEAIWQRYQRDHEASDRDRLVLHYLSVARRTVDHLPFQGNALMSRDDLYGHALIGLMEAIDSFDPARGIRFETFAGPRVRGAVLDALRGLDWMPRSFRRQQSQLRRTHDALTEELGRVPTRQEVCGRLDWTDDELTQHIDRSRHSFIQSLDEPLTRSDEAGETRGSTVADSAAEDPLQRVLNTDQRQEVRSALRRLSSREQSVLSAYYFGNRTLKEIANDLGVTESRVCQIHTQALRRLRQTLGVNPLPV